jgi:serine/threonine protein kinase
MVQHLNCRRVKEREIHFDSHMSGFVYKVRVHGRLLIKKEIPGPDTVDEFLYEINALNQLYHSENVIQFYGIVVDDREESVTGLLISYAARGALIDVIYDSDHSLPWPTREKWARQIVGGLSEIHEAGFVQGDFTLSNIVIDENDDAKIIDINRRGCPIGWEPPEATPLIESNQRISMYIGVKSDLYQLGMVLWALATQEDEPDAYGRPLKIDPEVQVPAWYRRVVDTCLSVNPKNRVQAVQLLSWFPDAEDDAQHGRPNGSALSMNGDNRSRQDYLSPSGAPRIKTVHPPSDWSYVGWGSQHLDYPSRGRSPPSPMPSNQGDYDPTPYGHRMYTWSDSFHRAPTVPSVSDVLARESKGGSTTEPTGSGETLETYADGPYRPRRLGTETSKDDVSLAERGRSLSRNDYFNGHTESGEDEVDQHELTATWGAHPQHWHFGDDRDTVDSNPASRSREAGNRGNTGPNSQADSGKDVTEVASTPRESRGYSAEGRTRSISRGRSGRSYAGLEARRGGQQVIAMTTTTTAGVPAHDRPLDSDFDHGMDREEQQQQHEHDHDEFYHAASPDPDLGITDTATVLSRGGPDDVLKGIGSAHEPVPLARNDSDDREEKRTRQHGMILDEDLDPELDRSLRAALVTDMGSKV